MKDVNLLGAINAELRNKHIEPRTMNLDPNRVTWPYLRAGELSEDTEYLMRIIPSDDLKNPNGYVKKSMYQFPIELDLSGKGPFPKHSCHYVMIPACLDPNAPDPIKKVLTDTLTLMKGPSNYEYSKGLDGKVTEKTLKKDEDGNLLPKTPSDEFRDEIESNPELKMFLTVLSKNWTQYVMPVLICATCSTTKNKEGYDRYTHYVPDENEEHWVPRLFQINGVKDFETEVIPNLLPKTLDKPKKYVQWNDRYDGVNFLFKHTSGKPKSYKFIKDSVGSLPDEFEAKLEIADNYIDLVKRELKASEKTPDQMMNLLRSSPYSHYLVTFGILTDED